jgi:hypothetical protein
MTSRPPPLNRAWFSFFFHDPDLVHLARAILNVEAARQVAARLGLAVEEDNCDDFREFAVSVPTQRLDEAIREWQDARVSLGVIDCSDPEALVLCQRLGLECEWIEPSD